MVQGVSLELIEKENSFTSRIVKNSSLVQKSDENTQV